MESRTDEATSSTSYLAEDSIGYIQDYRPYNGYVEDSVLRAFYERVGYLPPLDDATIDVLNFLSKFSAEMADLKDAGRISPHMRVEFQEGLEMRNVRIDSDGSHNFEFRSKDGPNVWSPPLVPEDRKRYHEQLWANDLTKCKKQSLEAIFQRTMMVSMIDRYRLFCGYTGAGKQPLLEFSVEVPWTSLPMPTHAATQGDKFLTCPKPDLSVGFRRTELLSDCHWQSFPKPTKNLMCYEKTKDQVFDFLTIEAKRSYKNVDDEIARNQCLNNASQALHNMYEFFKEADREVDETVEVKGSKYRKIFFDRVRFFSVVAVPGAMKIRIHRAYQVVDDKRFEPVYQQYPLRFVYSDYKVVSGDSFTHPTVAKELTHIMVDYGVNELAVHLREAVATIDGKFFNYRKERGIVIRRDPTFYSYGQGPPPGRKTTQTPTASIISSHYQRSGSDTPRPVRKSQTGGSQRSTTSDRASEGTQRGPGRPSGSKGKKPNTTGSQATLLNDDPEDHQASPSRAVHESQTFGMGGLSVSQGASVPAEGQGKKRGRGRPPGSRSKKSRLA